MQGPLTARNREKKLTFNLNTDSRNTLREIEVHEQYSREVREIVLPSLPPTRLHKDKEEKHEFSRFSMNNTIGSLKENFGTDLE